MKKINMNVKDEVYESLDREFKNFIRLSLKCDSGFVSPSFDNFLLAKLSDNTTFLTEEAVQHLMMSGQYAWAKRALDKDFPDVVAILISQASNYGFHIAVRQDWGSDDLTAASKAWATAIVKQAKGDESQIDILAAQIKSSAVSIGHVEEKLKTPAWRLAASLAQQLHDAKIAVEHARGSVAHEKLGALRSLLKLGIAYGTVKEKDEKEILERLRVKKPYLFEEEESFLTRAIAWWRSVFA
ncbi:DUF4088 domain-containing protein [Herbaspirillum sp. meg3]|uniref:DUF4088 family protein n=1 Tax=Herbaspirillum sp. meg3 TaxID=2025949 RepID=UPI000B97FDA3|nr:DUF4088 family protein [Herbaspirillum sp. meg3]ASU41011.1 DUF4088 domain-containing protein [Herbaspirillum sp. meg3]